MKKIMLWISYHNEYISPPNVAKLKARKENTQVPKLKTDLGVWGGGADAECKYLTGSESRYWLILVSSGFNLSCTLKSPGDLNKVLIPGLHPHRWWFNWFGTRLSCLPNLGLGTPMEMNPLWVHSQNCMRKWGRVRRCKKREYFHDQTTTKTI